MSKTNFIQRIAAYILEHYPKDTDQLTVVFPNKRASIFLKKELSLQAGKTIWMPQIQSVEEIFAQWLGMGIADPLSIIFDLIEIHLISRSDGDEYMDQFAGYAHQIAKDFDDIDHHLVDEAALFSFLSEAKALELWHPDGSALSTYERNYLHFFKSLHGIYKALEKCMLQHNSAYPGAIARKLSSFSDAELIEKSGQNQLLFVGFNALSPAEENIITRLQSFGKARLLWDVDEYYMKSNAFGLHEAGLPLRKFLERSRQTALQWTSNALLTEAKTIRFIGASGQAGQAKALGHALNLDESQSESAEKTAVVLADESLLFPVINSIPNHYKYFNVTMGYPFAGSAVYAFILLCLHLENSKFSKGETQHILIEPLVNLLLHESIAVVLPKDDQQTIQQLVNKILTDGNTAVTVHRMNKLLPDLSPNLQQLFGLLLAPSEKKASQSLTLLITILDWLTALLHENDQNSNHQLIINQVVVASRLLLRLQKLFENKHELFDTGGLMRLVQQLAPAYKMHFLGEPLEGLQVMGLLETRNLDFTTVHLLSVNEGILPSDKNRQSLIPYDIRKAFELPVHQEKQAIYAFHFFHLLQFASNINLYYNVNADTFGGGEMSRFMLQLKYELAQLNPKIHIIEENFSFPVPPQQQFREIAIEKTEAVVAQLKKRLSDGISPTNLSVYVRCPLQFYLQYVLKIEEPQLKETGIGLNQMGSVLHQTLELLYQDKIGLRLTPEHLKTMRQKAETILLQCFREAFPDVMLEQGRNKITFTVSLQFIHNFLDKELLGLKDNSLIIISLEEKLTALINTPEGEVLLKGTADRIDEWNQHQRIIDYKTGKVDIADIKIDDFNDFLHPKKAKGLQLILYNLMFLLQNPNVYLIPVSGIISLKKYGKGLLEASFPASNNRDEFVAMGNKIIAQLVGDMLNAELPISQTSDENTCSMCTYKSLCMRDNDNNTYF